MEERGSGALGDDFCIVCNQKPKGQWRREDPELWGVISVLFFSSETEGTMEEGGSGALGGDFCIVLNKKQTGKWRRENPELWGVISVLFLMRNQQENGGGRIRSTGRRFLYWF